MCLLCSEFTPLSTCPRIVGNFNSSGFTPVLVVLDPTPNPKLEELRKKFVTEGGEVYIGPAAWQHFASLAGQTMSRFLDLYVHAPIQALLAEVPVQGDSLPDLHLSMTSGEFTASFWARRSR